MYQRSTSGKFDVLADIDFAQAVPGNDITSQYIQDVSVNSSLYDISDVQFVCMNVGNTEIDAEMPSAVPTVVSESCTDGDSGSESGMNGHSDTTGIGHGAEGIAADYDCTGLDSGLRLATNQSWESGSVLPLLKEELKMRIQSKRLREGKEELKVDFTEPEQYSLTEEEQEKVTKRRVQNREAARRFRAREKSKGDTLQKECKKLEAMNTRLRYIAVQLKGERDKLRASLENHLRYCPYRASQTAYGSIFPTNNQDQR